MSSVENQNLAERSLIREDSLEYFIKFPPPQTFSHATGNYAEGDKIINEDVNVPIILLFGWAGCQDRYLKKYSKIYEDQRFVMFDKNKRNLAFLSNQSDLVLKILSIRINFFFWFSCAMCNLEIHFFISDLETFVLHNFQVNYYSLYSTSGKYILETRCNEAHWTEDC